MGDEFDINKIMKDWAASVVNPIVSALGTNADIDDIIDKFHRLEDSSTSIAKQFGLGREQMQNIKATLADAVTSAYLLGGSLSELEGIQKNIGSTIGRNVMLTTDAFEDYMEIQRVTGQDSLTISKNFKDVGFSIFQVGKEMQGVVNSARQLGVDVNQVSQSVVNNIGALNKYNFEGGVKGLAEMAAQATMLRIDMGKSLAFAEKVFEPEGAIQMAAALQRLGVTQSELLDPLRLMDLAANDPAELQNQLSELSKSFVRMKSDGSFEILPGAKRRLREIETQLGMTNGELSRMALASADAEEKMKRIKFSQGFDEDEKRFIANMAEMGKKGEYVLKIDGKEFDIQGAMQEFSKDNKSRLKELMQPKTMEQLAQDQLTAQQSMAASLDALASRTSYAFGSSQIGEELVEAQKEIYGYLPKLAGAEAVSIKGIREGVIDGIVNEFAVGLSKEGADVTKLTEEMEKKLSNYIVTAGQQTVTQIGEVGKDLQNSQNLFIKGLKELTNVLKEASTSISKETGAKAKDFVLETLPMDSIQIVGGKLVGGTHPSLKSELKDVTEQGTTNTTKDININIKHEVDVKANSPNIDTAQLVLALQNGGYAEQIVKSINDTLSNSGLLVRNNRGTNPLQTLKNMTS
jgi:hypothetical protein